MNIKARSIALCFCFVVVDFLNAADFTANNLTVSQDATIAGASGFGTVYTGVGTAATSSLGYRFSVTQSTEEVPVEVTQSSWVEGYYQDQTVTVEDYGTISAGYWESMYTYQVVGYEWLPPVYDEFGFPIEGIR